MLAPHGLLKHSSTSVQVKPSPPKPALHAHATDCAPAVHSALVLQPIGPTQDPAAQTSPVVQPLLSLHAAVLLVNVQPEAGSHALSVHTLPSLQLRVGPATQLPPAHVSPPVQTLPSEQLALLAPCWQPASGSQLSSVQALPSAQFLTPLEVHAPAAHTSVSVHTLPSLHVAVLATCRHPDPPSQLSSVQGLPSLHEIAAPDRQAPPAHWSPTVHTLPSLHGTVLLVDLHPVAVSQLSVVQGLLSSQVLGPVGVQTPLVQASPTVQLLLSEQLASLLTCRQPLTALQESVVHGLPSSHPSVLPDWHAPAAQTSPVVQTEPSEHGKLLLALTQPAVGAQLSVVQGLPSSQGT